MVAGTVEGEVVGVRARDGAVLWRSAGSSGLTAVAAGRDTVYTAGPHGVTALDPDDGRRRWRWPVTGVASLRAAAEGLLTCGLDGTVRAVAWPSAAGATPRATSIEEDPKKGGLNRLYSPPSSPPADYHR
jgi:outer membrane protein assembly factor BamB